MTRMLAVVERDLRRFSRNPIVVLAGIFLPLVMLIILGNVFQGQLRHLPMAVVVLDTGQAARRVMQRLQGLEAGPRVIRVIRVSDPVEAERMVRAGRARAALVIPRDFSRDVVRGARPELGLLLDNTDAIAANAIHHALREAFTELGRDVIPIREATTLVQLRAVDAYRRLDYDASLVPGAVIMALFVGSLGVGAMNLVLDKFLGIHESYLVTPLTKFDIVGGLLISGSLIVSISATTVLLVGSALTGIRIPFDPALLGLMLALIILTAVGLLAMLFLVMSRMRHPRVVAILGGFLNVIFFFPSGAVYPIESFPPWLSVFSHVNPETYAVHALKALLFKGAGFGAVAGDFLFLAGFAVVMVVLATTTFKRGL